MMTTAMNPYIDYDYDDDQTVFHEYSGHPPFPPVYNKLVQEQQQSGESKPRRRRKKNRGGDEVDDEKEGGSGMMMRKRKLSEEQVNLLELSFDNEHMLESDRKDRLASELGLDPRQVAVWFQNRRARWKSKKLEEEYNRLKCEHETTVLEKCKLEIEVLNLKQRLSESEKEIQILMERSTSNFSMTGQPFHGFQGMEDIDFYWFNSPS